MDEFIANLQQTLGTSVPNLIGAIAILIVGWIVAVIAAWATKTILSKTHLDDRLAGWTGGRPAKVTHWAATAVFWVLILFTLVGFLQALQLTAVSEPLNQLLNQVFAYLPKLGGALLILALAWILATIARALLVRSLQTFALDDRLNTQLSDPDQPVDSQTRTSPIALSETLGNALYWFIFLLFLPGVLEALQLQSALLPIRSLLDDILAILPNILAAVLIGTVGWFIARIVRLIVTNLLKASGFERVGARFGFRPAPGQPGLAWLGGTIVYILVLIPIAIAALNALRIEAISVPAIAMLEQILQALPRIFTATVILFAAYILGLFIGDLLTTLLTNIGFNNIFRWLGLQVAEPSPPPPAPAPRPSEPTTVLQTSTVLQTPEEPSGSALTSVKTPSEIVGKIALGGILLVFLLPATDVLQFAPLTALISGLLVILGQVLVGVVVFAVGLYLANLAYQLLASSGGAQAKLVAQAARIAILALVSAMALQQMGIATSIVNLAFGLLFGAVAVAVAVAFGFGSMDVAGEQVRHWLQDFKQKDDAAV
ncbi:mechanosensitive ion channel [Synechococcales cyanobacterium C]|uniref:Mechanosensitive ion channel n=1 Tax=Petrachloros mirabilis ULC683 TaxID=2781853 RepID=A0A8K2A0C1_9CYAN|nr:mechanosensitive ion channel [Petrachloros mirabilis]NCJ08474.1 mechanosensitive ion channel [Petrachloros mirabilis ULC683]